MSSYDNMIHYDKFQFFSTPIIFKNIPINFMKCRKNLNTYRAVTGFILNNFAEPLQYFCSDHRFVSDNEQLLPYPCRK